jgi:hypothetical protein
MINEIYVDVYFKHISIAYMTDNVFTIPVISSDRYKIIQPSQHTQTGHRFTVIFISCRKSTTYGSA